MKLKSLFSKKNMQRVLSLVCALFIGAAGVICCAAPAVAVSNFDPSLGFGLLLDSNSVFSVAVDSTLPLTGYFSYGSGLIHNFRPFDSLVISNNGTTCHVLFSDSVEPSTFALFVDSTITVSGAYLYFPPNDYLYDHIFISMLSTVGTFVQFRDSYFFKNDLTLRYPPTFNSSIPSSGSFSSNSNNFNYIYFSQLSPDAYLRYAIVDNDSVSSFVNVYSFSADGGWVDDSFRSLTFDVFVPVNYYLATFMLDNEYNPSPPSFLDRLSSGFIAAIGWLGDFFTSLFTGNFALAFVLVSVGFGLTLLSFGWRWFRRWLWGY